MASTCFFAAKRAIEAARAELDLPAGYFQLGMILVVLLFLYNNNRPTSVGQLKISPRKDIMLLLLLEGGEEISNRFFKQDFSNRLV